MLADAVVRGRERAKYEIFQAGVRSGVAQDPQVFAVIFHVLLINTLRWFLMAKFTRSDARARVINCYRGGSCEVLLER